MTQPSFSVRCALLFAVLGGLSSGCSLFKSLNADQCQTNAECKQFGVDYTCSGDKVCVAPMANTGGDSSMGGAGAGAGTAGSSTAGSGGGTVAECVANADCIDAHNGAPYICKSGACVSLTLETHCPFVIAGTDAEPTSYLTQAGKPIVIGAYVPIDVAAPEQHPYTLNYRFALEEFMTGTLGGPGSPHRPIVIVLCQSTQPDLKSSIGHLVNTLEVPGILATLPSTDLAAAFDEVTATGRKVFLLGPFEADSSLAAADDKGLMWHMLGPTTDLIPAYAPLLAAAEKYVRANQNVGTSIKVAVVNSDLSYSQDMAAALPSAVQINGSALSSSANKNNYQRLQVSVANVATPDVSAVVNKLGPKGSADIIISLGGSEFVNAILPQIQMARGTSSSDSPFYILSPSNTFAPQLSSLSYFAPPTMSYTNLLMAGVNYASVLDDSLYQSYLAAIQARFPGVAGLESRENLYDAAYYMFYALSAASFSSDPFDGADVAAGMKHLVQLGSNPVTVGPGATGENMFIKVLTFLKLGSDVELTGTLGPPDFNLVTGARRSQGSVWCVTKKLPAAPFVKFDALRLQPPDNTSLALAAGDSFCFPGFFP